MMCSGCCREVGLISYQVYRVGGKGKRIVADIVTLVSEVYGCPVFPLCPYYITSIVNQVYRVGLGEGEKGR